MGDSQFDPVYLKTLPTWGTLLGMRGGGASTGQSNGFGAPGSNDYGQREDYGLSSGGSTRYGTRSTSGVDPLPNSDPSQQRQTDDVVYRGPSPSNFKPGSAETPYVSQKGVLVNQPIGGTDLSRVVYSNGLAGVTDGNGEPVHPVHVADAISNLPQRTGALPPGGWNARYGDDYSKLTPKSSYLDLMNSKQVASSQPGLHHVVYSTGEAGVHDNSGNPLRPSQVVRALGNFGGGNGSGNFRIPDVTNDVRNAEASGVKVAMGVPAGGLRPESLFGLKNVSPVRRTYTNTKSAIQSRSARNQIHPRGVQASPQPSVASRSSDSVRRSYMSAPNDRGSRFIAAASRDPNPRALIPRDAKRVDEGGFTYVYFPDGSPPVVITPHNHVTWLHRWQIKLPKVSPDDQPGKYNWLSDHVLGIPNPSQSSANAFWDYSRRGVEPDYVSINGGALSKALKYIPTGGLMKYVPNAAGYQGQIVIDRYGRVYIAPAGLQVGVGKGGPWGGWSATAGWLDRNQGIPSQKELSDWMSGNSFNVTVGGGRVPTVGVTRSSGDKGWENAYEIGYGNEQIGGNYVYDFQGKRIPGLGWDHDVSDQDDKSSQSTSVKRSDRHR